MIFTLIDFWHCSRYCWLCALTRKSLRPQVFSCWDKVLLPQVEYSPLHFLCWVCHQFAVPWTCVSADHLQNESLWHRCLFFLLLSNFFLPLLQSVHDFYRRCLNDITIDCNAGSHICLWTQLLFIDQHPPRSPLFNFADTMCARVSVTYERERRWSRSLTCWEICCGNVMNISFIFHFKYELTLIWRANCDWAKGSRFLQWHKDKPSYMCLLYVYECAWIPSPHHSFDVSPCALKGLVHWRECTIALPSHLNSQC